MTKALFYNESTLARLYPGCTKQEFLTYYASDEVRQPVVRAAQRDGSGVVTEVITLEMVSTSKKFTIFYWFVFRNGALEQWGRPEDWESVKGNYHVTFNPAPAVRNP